MRLGLFLEVGAVEDKSPQIFLEKSEKQKSRKANMHMFKTEYLCINQCDDLL